MHRKSTNLLALSLVCLSALGAASAAEAEIATVTVRVEGTGETLLPATAVTTNNTAVVKDGNSAHSCEGEKAIGALQLATNGNWSGKWYGGSLGYSWEMILGESHPLTSSAYWGFWLDHRYSSKGICEASLKTGDSLLFAVVCQGECPYSGTPTPLGIETPATATSGASVPVEVLAYSNATGEPAPSEGATVSYEGHSTTTDAAGKATLDFASSGAQLVKVSKPGSIRTETTICVNAPGASGCTTPGQTMPDSPGTPGNSGVAGFQTASSGNGPDALAAALSSPGNGRVYRRGHGPQLIVGKISSTSPVTSVSLSLRRIDHGRCYGYEARRGRFQRARCGSSRPFRVSREAGFSYFLPNRLPPGRYVLAVQAVDAAGTKLAPVRGKSVVVFYVR